MEQELYVTLQSTLSPDMATRTGAEQNLDRLLATPGKDRNNIAYSRNDAYTFCRGWPWLVQDCSESAARPLHSTICSSSHQPVYQKVLVWSLPAIRWTLAIRGHQEAYQGGLGSRTARPSVQDQIRNRK